LVLLINSYVNFFTDQRKKNIRKMENMVDLMHQARVFLIQNPQIIPLAHVEEVILHGGVDRYVVAGGTDIYSAEGNDILNWETALYLQCLELCNLGLGNRPYLPHPYMRDPVLVDEDAEAEGNEENEWDEENEVDDPYPGPDEEVAVMGEFYSHIEQIIEGEIWLLGEYRAFPEGELPAEGPPLEDVPLLNEEENDAAGDPGGDVPVLAVQPNNHLTVEGGIMDPPPADN
jgi:hypothetical protein